MGSRITESPLYIITCIIEYLGVIALPGSAISALTALPGSATKCNQMIYAETTDCIDRFLFPHE